MTKDNCIIFMKKNFSRPKIFLGISGGVDSAVSAVLLKEKGYEVTGMYMRLWREKGSLPEEKAKEEEENARRAAEEAGINFKTVDLRREFKKEVVDYFLKEYERGLTPNPCVRCNREIKFGLFAKKAFEMGADFIATGHYARIRKKAEKDEGGKEKISYRLIKAKDAQKDQSYFLYNLDQKTLKKTIFPLGNLTKEEVRVLAEKNNLSAHNKSESQEICFISEKYYGEFLKRQKVKMKEGDIVNEEGEVLGRHRGLPLYTPGQRRDIRIGGTGPYFVTGIDYRNNRLIVGKNGNSEKLFANKFSLRNVSWIAGKPGEIPLEAKVRIRYRMEAVPAEITKEGSKFIVNLSRRSRATAPGQSAVFYKKDEVLGGGTVDKIME